MEMRGNTHVLHVDDDSDFVSMSEAFLEQENEQITIETATSADEGLTRLADIEFDCIISDYDMPGTDGIEFLKTVREEHPSLPFILFTGKGSEEIASEAVSAGVTDYLQKQRGTDQYAILANRIQNTVEQYRATNRAANLDRIRTLSTNVNQALVRADSREEIETQVCEIISSSEPYLFTWIGKTNQENNRIEPCASAGINERYLDTITITTDETATGQGPGGTAIRERRIVASQNITEDPTFEPWQEEATERGYQSVAAVPLEHDDTLYGVLGVYADRPNAFDNTEQNLLTELGDNIAHAFYSFDNEQKLRALHDVADDLTAANSVEDICQCTIETSQNLLAFDLIVISIEEKGMLVPRAVSEDISPDEVGTIPIEEGMAGKTYRRNESFLISDVDAHDDANPQGPYKSAISVPVGKHGNIQIADKTTDAFDETDLRLTELLATHTENALDRLSREQELQQQNERLDQFASVVSHDLRNPLNVAQGRVELAREEYDGDHLDDAANAVDRSLTLINDILMMTRKGQEVSEYTSAGLNETIRRCWQHVDTKDATLAINTSRTVRADMSQLKRLLENLIRNAIKHGGSDVTITIGDLDDGVYIADDGPGIPATKHEQVFEVGYSTTDDGAGFGLDIVQKIVEAHDWQIRVTDSEDGGAQFEITGIESA